MGQPAKRVTSADVARAAGVSRTTQGLTLVTHLAGTNARPLPDVCATLEASAVTALESFSEQMAEALYQAGAQVVLPVQDPSPAMREVGRLQAACLIGRGSRRLGYALPAELPDLAMARQRLDGAALACAAAGIDPPVALEVGLDPASARRAVAAWQACSVTGVGAYNDEYAMAVLAGARAHGLAVPGDMAVVGADDIPVARLAAPPLSTVAFDLHEAGLHRAEAIAAGLQGRQARRAVPAVGPRLIQRESA